MQENYKKEFKSRGTLVPLLILIVIIVVLLALILIFNKQNNNFKAPKIASRENITLNERAVSDIDKIEINSSEKGIYSISRKNGNYVIDEHTKYPVKQSTIQNMFEAISNIQAEDMVFENFDIDKIKNQKLSYIEVKVIYSDGQQNKWIFTDDIDKHLNKQYILNEQNTLYVENLNHFEAFDYSPEQLHEVPDFNLNVEKFSNIKIKNANQILELNKTNDGWEMIKPIKYMLNHNNTKLFISKLSKIMLSTYVAEGTKENIEKFKISNDSSIEITSTENSSNSSDKTMLHFGKRHNAVSRYCLFENKIYLASDFAFSDIINFDSNFLISDRFINIPAAKLKNISLKSDKLSTELKVELVERLHENNELVKDKHGNIIYDIWISADKKRKSSEEFLNVYQDLLHLNAVSFSSKADSPREPKYEIIFETFSQKYTYKLYENKYNYSLYINDVSVYEFDKAKIDNLFEKLLNLSQIQ